MCWQVVELRPGKIVLVSNGILQSLGLARPMCRVFEAKGTKMHISFGY